MIGYKSARFFTSRQIGCVTDGGNPIPFRSILKGLYRGLVIVPIDICYNHSCYADDPTGRFPSASYQRSPRLTPSIGRLTGATRSVVIRPATRGHAIAMPPGSGDLDVVGALCITDPSGKGRRIAHAILNAPPTDRDKS